VRHNNSAEIADSAVFPAGLAGRLFKDRLGQFLLHPGPVLGILGPRARLKLGTLNIAITIIFIDIRKKFSISFKCIQKH
jgi:hypothetical protein